MGRTVAGFKWWDDAVSHAHWLAEREGLRYRVYRSWSGLWVVRVAVAGTS